MTFSKAGAPPFSFALDETVEFRLSPDLSLAPDPDLSPGGWAPDGAALLSWDRETGRVTARAVRVEEANRDSGSDHCLKCLFDVWCIGRYSRCEPDGTFKLRA